MLRWFNNQYDTLTLFKTNEVWSISGKNSSYLYAYYYCNILSLTGNEFG